MSQEDVEIVQEMYDAFNRGDLQRARRMLHEDAELHQATDAPDTDSYYGREEWERGFAIWLSEWESPRFEPLEASSVGEGVIMRVRLSGTGRMSRVPVSTEFFHAWTMRDGKAYRCAVRSSRAEALKAVGLEE